MSTFTLFMIGLFAAGFFAGMIVDAVAIWAFLRLAKQAED